MVGVTASATVAGWLFQLFGWLDVQMDPENGALNPVAWGSMLATWAASEFAGQTLAANVAQRVVVIWFVATAHAAILLWYYSVMPHPVFLAGATIGLLIAYRLKDSDLLHMVRRVPAKR